VTVVEPVQRLLAIVLFIMVSVALLGADGGGKTTGVVHMMLLRIRWRSLPDLRRRQNEEKLPVNILPCSNTSCSWSR
jgi:hypothetical protein